MKRIDCRIGGKSENGTKSHKAHNGSQERAIKRAISQRRNTKKMKTETATARRWAEEHSDDDRLGEEERTEGDRHTR